MERIFKKNDSIAFGNIIKDILPEALEASAKKFRDVDCNSYQEKIVYILTLLYGHVNRLSENQHTIYNMLHELYFMSLTEEKYFLAANRSQIKELRSFIGKMSSSADEEWHELLQDAGSTLYYYYQLYESGYHTKSYNDKTYEEYQLLCWSEEERRYEGKLIENRDLPVMIKKKLDKKVCSQEKAKRIIAMAVSAFLMDVSREPVLMIGPTGCGKTYIMEILSQMEEIKDRVYIYFYSITELTPNGYVGDNVKDFLKSFNENRGDRKGIIFLDEFDKVFAYGSADCQGNDTNQAIIHELLTVISGNATNYCVDTHDILFIFGGTFENLEDQRREKKKIGFSQGSIEMDKDSDIRNELIKMGCSRQMLGRIGKIVSLAPLDQASLERIMTDPDFGVLSRKKEEFATWGFDLKWEDDFVKAAAEKAMNSRQGARFIKSVVETCIDGYDYEMCENGNSMLYLNKGVLDGGKPYIE